MIARIWHGAVPKANKRAFAEYLKENYTDVVRADEGNAEVYVRMEEKSGWAHFYVGSIWYCMEDIFDFVGEDINKADVVDDPSRFGMIGDPIMLNLYVRGTDDPFRQEPLSLAQRRISVGSARQRIIELFAEDTETAERLKEADNPRIWEIFRKEAGNCVCGDFAKETFDDAERRNALIFMHESKNEDEAQRIANGDLTSEEIDNMDSTNDVYIVGENFTWVYIRPTNTRFGPYFAFIGPSEEDELVRTNP